MSIAQIPRTCLMEAMKSTSITTCPPYFLPIVVTIVSHLREVPTAAMPASMMRRRGMHHPTLARRPRRSPVAQRKLKRCAPSWHSLQGSSRRASEAVCVTHMLIVTACDPCCFSSLHEVLLKPGRLGCFMGDITMNGHDVVIVDGLADDAQVSLDRLCSRSYKPSSSDG